MRPIKSSILLHYQLKKTLRRYHKANLTKEYWCPASCEIIRESVIESIIQQLTTVCKEYQISLSWEEGQSGLLVKEEQKACCRGKFLKLMRKVVEIQLILKFNTTVRQLLRFVCRETLSSEELTHPQLISPQRYPPGDLQIKRKLSEKWGLIVIPWVIKEQRGWVRQPLHFNWRFSGTVYK